MQPLDLKQFIWISKKTKESFRVLAITDYKNYDVVVYRSIKDHSKVCILSVSDFCQEFEATYEIT